MNQKELKEARQIAQDRAQALWDKTSDVSPEMRPFVALERGIRFYGRVEAYAFRRCETDEARTIMSVAGQFYSDALKELAFAQSTDLAFRIWLCRDRLPARISYCFNHARGVYITRTDPVHFHVSSSLDLRILRHMREEARMLIALNNTCDEAFKVLAKKYENVIVSCHPHTLMSFLVRFFSSLARISVGQDLSNESSPLMRFHSKYTLDLVYDVILFFVGQDDEDWPPLSYQAYVSMHPETDYARIDVACSVTMTPTLWDALSNYLVADSKAAQYLPELGGHLEPLTEDYGYGQGVSLYIPWATV